MATNTATNGTGATTLLNFSAGAGGGTINGSVNVSSVTRQSTGNYTVNFTTSYANANYVMVEMGQTPASIAGYVVLKPTTSPATGSVQIQNNEQGGGLTDSGFMYFGVIAI